MGAFFDGTLAGLHQTLRDGQENLRRQLPELAAGTEYRDDVMRAFNLYAALLAVLPPVGGMARGPEAGAHPSPPANPGRGRSRRA